MKRWTTALEARSTSYQAASATPRPSCHRCLELGRRIRLVGKEIRLFYILLPIFGYLFQWTHLFRNAGFLGVYSKHKKNTLYSFDAKYQSNVYKATRWRLLLEFRQPFWNISSHIVLLLFHLFQKLKNENISWFQFSTIPLDRWATIYLKAFFTNKSTNQTSYSVMYRSISIILIDRAVRQPFWNNRRHVFSSSSLQNRLTKAILVDFELDLLDRRLGRRGRALVPVPWLLLAERRLSRLALGHVHLARAQRFRWRHGNELLYWPLLAR